jgi:hypothetical protein
VSLLGGAEYGAAGQSAKDMSAVIRDPGGAARWLAGANGEKATALWLRPLTYRGWVILHDRSIPGMRANVDHILIGPGGLFVVDSKMWRKSALSISTRRTLLREGVEVDLSVSAMETSIVEQALGTRAKAILCVHGCRLPHRGYKVRTSRGGLIYCLNARPLLWHLAAAQRRFDRHKIERLTRRAQASFPPYR